MTSPRHPSKATSAHVEDKDGYGLRLFNESNRFCREKGGFEVDIVAVHGLNGHRDETWESNDLSTPDSTRKSLWLRDALPLDFPGSRIFSFGYNSGVWMSDSISSIDEFARQLLNDLALCRREHAVSPLDPPLLTEMQP